MPYTWLKKTETFLLFDSMIFSNKMEGETICIELLSVCTYSFQITVVKSAFEPAPLERQLGNTNNSVSWLLSFPRSQARSPFLPVPPRLFFITYQVSSWWVQTSSLLTFRPRLFSIEANSVSLYWLCHITGPTSGKVDIERQDRGRFHSVA